MARGINKVCLLGNVGKDPEVRSTQSGITVCNFSLATADRRKNGDEWVDSVEWHNLIAFGRTAEIVRDYVQKGSQLHIEGKLQTSSWEDKQTGQKRYKTEIIINELTLLGSPGGGRGDSGGGGTDIDEQNRRNRERSAAQHPQDYADTGIDDSDIPF